MKIFLSGSMAFAKEMVRIKKELSALGYQGIIPEGTQAHLNDANFVDNLDSNLRWCIEHDVMRKNFKQVAQADAILVLNYPRKGMDGYIGASALLEMGIAHFLEKRIYLMFAHPHFDKVRWAHEVAIMQPTIINGDLSKIS